MIKGTLQNWQTKKISEICETGAGGTPLKSHKDYYENGDIPWLRSGEVCQKEIYRSELFITEKGLKNSSAKIFPEDTVLVAMYGATAGQVGILRFKATTNQAVCGILPNKNMLPEFLYYFFLIEKDNLISKATGNAQPNISQIKIKNTQIPILTLPEQLRIVKILDEVFEKTAKAKENAEKNLKNSKELFESYLQSIFTNPGKDWEGKKLGEVCEMINRGVSPKYTEKKGLCVLNQKCIRNHKINFDLARLHDVKNKKVGSDKYIQIGDVLVNSTGTGTLGRVAQVREITIEATTDSHVTIVRPMKNLFHNEFFGYGLIFIEKEIAKRGDGCGGQTELARNTLKNDFKISYPKSLTEQKSIVKKLDALSAETKKLETIYKQKTADLEELKKSVLKKAFSGEL